MWQYMFEIDSCVVPEPVTLVETADNHTVIILTAIKKLVSLSLFDVLKIQWEHWYC